MAESKKNEDSELTESTRIREPNRMLDWEGINSERLNQLKQTRSAKRGIITKAKNGIRELMLDFANIPVVNERVEEFKRIVYDFNEAHRAYHSQLKEECDLVESEEYSKAVNHSVAELTGEIARWVASEEFVLRPLESVTPQDSVSNVGSRTSVRSKRSSLTSKTSRSSSLSAAKARAAARRSVLQAEAANFESFQAIQREELSLQQKKKALELHTEIAKAEAEELVYAEVEASISPTPSQVAISKKSIVSQIPDSEEKTQPKQEDESLSQRPEGWNEEI